MHKSGEGHEYLQPGDAAFLILDGYYGGYIDSGPGPTPKILICEDCIQRLEKLLPALAEKVKECNGY